MKLIRRDWFDVSRADVYRLWPIGDIHLGNVGCDEKLLRSIVDRIAQDDKALWIGMGDYCLSEDTEILTDHGWRGLETINRDDLAVVYDPITGMGHLQPILKKWVNEDHRELVHLGSSHVDALVTPNHRMLVNHNVGGQWKAPEVLRADRLLDGKTKHIWRVPVACQEWPEQDYDWSGNLLWFQLKGWIDTEGSLERAGNYERLQISQSAEANPQHVEAIDGLLKRLDLHPHRSTRDWGVIVWRFNGEDTRRIHDAVGRKGERIDWMMNANAECLEAYFNALMDGDGAWSRQCFVQKEKALVEIFQELCFKLGYRASVNQRSYDDQWQCHFGRGRGTHSLLREVEFEPYQGPTWCISTEQGFITTRRNDKIAVVGNCDFINMNDPRFEPDSLADWVKMAHLGDLARAQAERFLDFVEPIAGKCIGLVEGNHERSILKHFERSIYSDIVTGIKDRGGMDADTPLALGYSGWLLLYFYRVPEGQRRQRCTTIKVNVHHGFVGGKLAGAKALNMQRWLWTHEADLVIFGHSHNTMAQVESVEQVRGSRVVHQHRMGMYCGTFANGMRYAEQRGYFPAPVTVPYAQLKPGSKVLRDVVSVVTG